MPYDPTLPANNSPIVSAELRAQFAGLKTWIDVLQTQLQPLMPVLTHVPGGQWAIFYPTTGPVNWLIWARNDANPVWTSVGESAYTDFPQPDSQVNPGGTWWQVKFSGADDNDQPCTAFSNIISFGPVPD